MVANVNVRVDSEVKNAAEIIFKKLVMTMSSAINMFLRQTINDNGLPFQPVLRENELNQETLDAIEEGRRLARDPNVKRYSSIEELRKALDEI
jgi:DNA-damage-inducible protein J